MNTEITKADLEKYKRAQAITTAKCMLTGDDVVQTKYGYYRWKESGLSVQKYMQIADNEDKYFGGKVK